MKLENYELGEKLEQKQLGQIAWGGNTSSNGHITKTSGDDCDTVNSGDTDTGGSNGDPLPFA